MSGIATDAENHVWVLQRPASLTEDERGATLNPPLSKCCAPAPPVLEFDAAGNLLRSWGGPGTGFQWPQNEHGIHVDAKGYVWITGNGESDGQILKFTRDGRFVMQIGKIGPQTGNADGRNHQVLTLLRDTGEVVSTLGRPGRYAGEFHWVHDLAIDSNGNLYAGEVDNGKRAQKFVPQP